MINRSDWFQKGAEWDFIFFFYIWHVHVVDWLIVFNGTSDTLVYIMASSYWWWGRKTVNFCLLRLESNAVLTQYLSTNRLGRTLDHICPYTYSCAICYNQKSCQWLSAVIPDLTRMTKICETPCQSTLPDIELLFDLLLSFHDEACSLTNIHDKSTAILYEVNVCSIDISIWRWLQFHTPSKNIHFHFLRDLPLYGTAFRFHFCLCFGLY